MRGLEQDPQTLRERMLAMHEQVATHDVDLWARSFLSCLGTLDAPGPSETHA